jgi:hypothetical protein
VWVGGGGLCNLRQKVSCRVPTDYVTRTAGLPGIEKDLKFNSVQCCTYIRISVALFYGSWSYSACPVRNALKWRCWMILTGETDILAEKHVTVSVCSPHVSTWTGLESNPALGWWQAGSSQPELQKKKPFRSQVHTRTVKTGFILHREHNPSAV